MSFQVALISSIEHCEYIRNMIKDTKLDYTLSFEICPSFKELPVVFERIQKNYDAFCTTGAFAKEAILRTHPGNIKPVVSISESVAEFYHILLELLYENRACDFSRIIFDYTLWLPDFQDITALDFAKGTASFNDKKRGQAIHKFSLQELLDVDQTIIAHARSRWNSGSIDLVICRHSYAYAALKKEGIPCVFAYPSPENINDTLLHLSDELNLIAMNDNLPAVIYLTCPQLQSASAEDITPENTGLQKCLLDFDLEYTTGMLMKKASGGFELYTARRTLQRITDNFSQCMLRKYLLGKLGLLPAIGYGSGRDVMTARSHALEACRLSAKNGISYAIDYDGTLLGSLDADVMEKKDIEVSEKLQKASKDTGLSILTLQRICSALDLSGTNEVTTQELAGILQVTVANTNRFMNHLLSSGYAAVVGEKKAPLRGRPTRVYRIDLQ